MAKPPSTHNPFCGQSTSKHVTRKKSRGTSDYQKPQRSNPPRYPEEQGKDQIELDQHGEVPPRRIQIHEIHRDIDEAKTEQE